MLFLMEPKQIVTFILLIYILLLFEYNIFTFTKQTIILLFWIFRIQFQILAWLICAFFFFTFILAFRNIVVSYLDFSQLGYS